MIRHAGSHGAGGSGPLKPVMDYQGATRGRNMIDVEQALRYAHDHRKQAVRDLMQFVRFQSVSAQPRATFR